MKSSSRFPKLLNAPVFTGLTDAAKLELIDECAVHDFDRGEHILTQGAPVPGMYIIAYGSVEFTSFNPEGQKVLIHLGRQGEVFGDIDCLADMPAAASCIAAGQATLLLATASQLRHAM